MIETALVGMAGAAVPEVLRIVACLRTQRAPTVKEFVASVLVTLLGACVLFFNTDSSSPLQIAVLGASFPQIFSGLVNAATAKPEPTTRSGIPGRESRRLWDYLSWRV